MLGLKNFMGNIGSHLKKGLLDWLFGALGGAGLVLPDTLDLKGIVSIVLQVLGLTYANFRARAVKLVGEPVVSALEKAADVFKVIVTEGIPGLWRFIKEKVEDLKSMVLDAIFDFIKEKVIIAGVTWVIGLLNPASAFFKACKAIYDIVMFFINRGSQILRARQRGDRFHGGDRERIDRRRRDVRRERAGKGDSGRDRVPGEPAGPG